MINFCVALTTLPSRIDNINQTLLSIQKQTLKPNKVFLNLPYKFKRFPGYSFSPEQINKISKYDIEISRCEDFGPGTKLGFCFFALLVFAKDGFRPITYTQYSLLFLLSNTFFHNRNLIFRQSIQFIHQLVYF